jgi:HSP20 family protein
MATTRPSNNLLTLMDQFFDDVRPIGHSLTRSFATTPALNVKEFEDRYEISLALAGIEPNKVRIELREKILNISYTHDEEKTDTENVDILRQEFAHYSFSRTVALPKNINEDSIKAKPKNGVLTITIEKLPEAKPKVVNIDMEE